MLIHLEECIVEKHIVMIGKDTGFVNNPVRRQISCSMRQGELVKNDHTRRHIPWADVTHSPASSQP
jgi:hypothetical protein